MTERVTLRPNIGRRSGSTPEREVSDRSGGAAAVLSWKMPAYGRNTTCVGCIGKHANQAGTR